MNFHELDNFNLADAVKFHRRLNPRLWGSDEHLLPEVREKLLAIAADFQEFLGVDDLKVQDITISGSNAAYSYTPHSDIDLHLVVDMPDDPVYQELFNAKKYQYNDEHDIKIAGIPVELYVQPADQEHHSQGIYSIKNGDWTQVPQRRRAKVDDSCVQHKAADLDARIHSAVKSGDADAINRLWDKIKTMRQTGLEQNGEFGCENITFKLLRNMGCIKKLKAAQTAARDRELSLVPAKKPRKKVNYGMRDYWYPGTAYAGQDHPAGTESEQVDEAVSGPRVVVVGDSIAVGIAQAAGLPSDAVVGRSTRAILSAIASNPAVQGADVAIVSAGTNDYPLQNGGVNPTPQTTIFNIGRIRNALKARQYVWILPFNRNAARDVQSAIGNDAYVDLADVATTRDRLHPTSYSAVAKAALSKFAKPGMMESVDPEINGELSWSDLDPGLSVEDKIEIFETYIIKGNLFETNDEHVKEYFLSLADMCDHLIPAQKYIVVPLVLINNRLMKLDQPSVMKFVGPDKTALKFKSATGEKTYPSRLMRAMSVTMTFAFSDSKTYDKFRNIVLLKYDFDLPPVVMHDRPGIMESMDPDHLKKILHRFYRSCVDKLNLQNPPQLRLETTPEWSKENGSFGQYEPETNTLILATSGRHVLDILRTMAHEMTHRQQDEREPLPIDAGETGSPWEDQANAMAGRIMRQWAEEQPEMFDGVTLEESAHAHLSVPPVLYHATYRPLLRSIKRGGLGGPGSEKKKWEDSIHGAVYLALDPHVAESYAETSDSVPDDWLDEIVILQISTAGLNPSKFMLDRNVRDNAGDTVEYHGIIPLSNISVLKKNMSEASGYIPTKKQARDPRFVMALTRDVRPGAVGKEANKLGLQTDSQGHPALLTAGLQKMLREFKEQDLFEIRMSPTNLKAMAAKTGALAGMEFEMIVPNTQGGDDYDQDPDYDMDERASSPQDIRDFFHDGDYNSRRDVDRLIDSMIEDFSDWQSEAFDNRWESDSEQFIYDYIRENMDDDDVRGLLSLEPDDDITKNEYQLAADKIVADQLEPWYEDAQESAREEFYDDDDLFEEWLADSGLTHMSDIESRYNITWPYYRSVSSGEGASVQETAESFSQAVGRPVKASTSYHDYGVERPAPGKNFYVVEPDGSLEPDDPDDAGLEFVSPPLPIDEMMSDLNKVKKWADLNGCYTNKSTGLHINISVPNYDLDRLDFVKLALLMGDEYVLNQFGRASNTYAKSAMGKVRDHVQKRPYEAKYLLDKMKGHMGELASKAIHSGSTEKYTSINTKNGHVEFRSPGGDWLGDNFDKIENTLLRFTVALSAAMDPAAYREEYLKKLYKILAPKDEKDPLAVFAKYAAGELPKQALKSFVRQAQTERQVKKSGEAIVNGHRWSVRLKPELGGGEVEVIAADPIDAKKEAIKQQPNWRFVDDSALTITRLDEPTAGTTTSPSQSRGRPNDPNGRYAIVRRDDQRNYGNHVGSEAPDYQFRFTLPDGYSQAQMRSVLQAWSARNSVNPDDYIIVDTTQFAAPAQTTAPEPSNMRWNIINSRNEIVHSFWNRNVQADANAVAREWFYNNNMANSPDGPFEVIPAAIPGSTLDLQRQRQAAAAAPTPVAGVQDIEPDVEQYTSQPAQTQWEVYDRSTGNPVFRMYAANQQEAWRKGQEWVANYARMTPDQAIDPADYSVRQSTAPVSESISVLEQRLRRELDALGNQPVTGPETPPKMPDGTIKVDVSDMYDWYKLGQHISDLSSIDKSTLGKGPPNTVFAFGSEDLENKYSHELTNLGLKTHDLDEPGEEDVDEAFDRPYKTKTEKSEYGDIDMVARLPDGTYLSIMFNNQGNDEWQVEFYRNNSQEVTGEGDAQRIFATVLNAIQKFVKKHKPLQITFSASKEVEPGQNSESRAKLYNRLVDRYAAALGYHARTIEHTNAVSYELTRYSDQAPFEENFVKQDVDESQEITKLNRLDSVLEKCIDLIHRGQETDPEKYGRVAACLIDNKNNHTYALNLPGPNHTRRHAERVAIDLHLKRHGRIGPDAVMVTTLSPCVKHMSERYGESCTDLLSDYGIKQCYAGWEDPTQQPAEDYPFNLKVTDNADIFNTCRDIAASFLPQTLAESASEREIAQVQYMQGECAVLALTIHKMDPQRFPLGFVYEFFDAMPDMYIEPDEFDELDPSQQQDIKYNYENWTLTHAYVYDVKTKEYIDAEGRHKQLPTIGRDFNATRHNKFPAEVEDLVRVSHYMEWDESQEKWIVLSGWDALDKAYTHEGKQRAREYAIKYLGIDRPAQDVDEGTEQITWIKPNFDYEWHEVEDQSKMPQVPHDVRQYYQKHFPNKDAWIQAVQHGRAVVLQPDHQAVIRNAPVDKESLLQVLAPTSHEGPIGPAKKKRVDALFAKGGPIEMPIVLKTSKGLWLIGGKTRLGTANYIKGIPAKVWVIGGEKDVDEAYDGPQMKFLKPGELSGSYSPQQMQSMGFKQSTNGAWYIPMNTWQRLVSGGQIREETRDSREANRASLASMYARDQAERNEFEKLVHSKAGGDYTKGAQMYAQLKGRPRDSIFGDEERQDRFMKMKFDFDTFTDDDWDNYWMMAQHCDKNRDFQRQALAAIEKYQGQDHSHYHYLYDRISCGTTGTQKYGTQNGCNIDSVNENFADGRHPEDKGDSKRLGVPTKSSVSNLRKFAKSHSGRAAQLAHWAANMKSGRAKKKTNETVIGNLHFPRLTIAVDDHAIDRTRTRGINPHTIDVSLKKLSSIADQLSQMEVNNTVWVYDTANNLGLGLRRISSKDMRFKLKTVVADRPYDGVTPIIEIS